MRVVIAARLSQERNGQTGIDTQDQDARSRAERDGHEVVATVADKISGRVSPFERPNLGKWLTDPNLIDSYDAIIVSKLDRLSRGRDWNIRSWAEEQDKQILVVSPELVWPPKPGDTATPLVWDTLVNISSAEWENTSMRYKRMRQHLKSVGSFAGRPSFGFRIVGDAKAKRLEPDPIEAPALTEAVALYLGGKSLRYLCTYLDDRGVPPPLGGKWKPTTLSQIFHNPAIAGRRTDLSGKTILRVPPLIDKDTWARLQAELDRKATRKGVAPSNSAMLTGVAVCAKCGGPMYRVNGSWKRADGTRVNNFYYRCSGTMTEPSRCKNMVRLAELEAAVEAYVNGSFGTSPEIETVTIAGTGHEDEIEEIERDIRELDLDDPGYDDRLAELRAERSRLKTQPQAKSFRRYVATGRIYADVWQELDNPGKRAFLLKNGMVIRVLKGQEPEITFPDRPEIVIEQVADGRISIRVRELPN